MAARRGVWAPRGAQAIRRRDARPDSLDVRMVARRHRRDATGRPQPHFGTGGRHQPICTSDLPGSLPPSLRGCVRLADVRGPARRPDTSRTRPTDATEAAMRAAVRAGPHRRRHSFPPQPGGQQGLRPHARSVAAERRASRAAPIRRHIRLLVKASGLCPSMRRPRRSFPWASRVARMEQMAFDEKVAAQLDAFYRTRDVSRRRELALAALDVQPADAVVDIGCGPGFYVAALAEQAASVTGIDPSASMLAVAAHKTEGHRNVTLVEGEAIPLPLAEASMDRALSVQVFEYIAEIPAALAEVHRVLRPGGRVVLWDIDWTTLSWHADDAQRMARMTQAWERHLVHPALPRTLAAALRAAGFSDVRCDSHVFCPTAMDLESFGGNLPKIIGGYLRALDDVASDDIAAREAELRDLDARGAYYFALTQCCFSATRPAQRADG